ncbi:outer membrane lipoprotein-sorting protein [Novispirillum sp. DQ9]|uniref:outer membrane lipoprotein-sorting protein n=1 Tax=Novispirillum sp. DQ9 TaxID=3398612 RepID=UPI003C7BFE05
MRPLALFLLALVVALPAVAADPSPDLLARVDAYRMPRKDVRVTVDVLEIDARSGALVEEHGYRVFLNDASDSVVEMLSPAERGRRVLMTDEAVWLHIPTTARPIRITPLQRLLGQANTGDVGRLHWAGGYRVAGVEEVPGGLVRPPLEAVGRAVGAPFRPLEGHPLRLLRLEALTATATYPRLEVWISAVDLAPVRADYFLTSGKRLKTGWFTQPQPTAQGDMVRVVAFADDEGGGRVTVMHTRDVADDRRPRSMFTVRGFTAEVFP